MKHKSLEECSNNLYNSDMKHMEKNLRAFVDTKERESHKRTGKQTKEFREKVQN